MTYLTAAVVLVGAIAVVDLVLTVGVVRRLREHTAELTALRGPAAGADLPAGSPVGDFTATSVTGRPVTRGTLTGSALVGFFSQGCPACAEQLPDFVAHAAGGAVPALAVVAGDPAGVTETVQALRPVATVVVEPADGPVQRAFAVAGFPTFVLVEDGVVADADWMPPPAAGRDAATAAAAG